MKMYCGVCKTFYDKEYELTKELETTKKLLEEARSIATTLIDTFDWESYLSYEEGDRVIGFLAKLSKPQGN